MKLRQQSILGIDSSPRRVSKAETFPAVHRQSLPCYDSAGSSMNRLNAEQQTDAEQAIGCGIPIRDVAENFAITETELRIELGLPQWQPEPVQDRQRTLFDCEGSR